MRRGLLSSLVLVLWAAPTVSAQVPAGSEFRVNTYTTSWQTQPSVAADAAGNFVVVWASWQDGSEFGVFGQRYDASGAPAGSEFRVNTYTTNQQIRPSVAADAAGNFVVVWDSRRQDWRGTDYGIFGQRYDASGAPAGSEFQVNTYTTGYQRDPSVTAAAAGNFVVVWESSGQDGGGVFGQRYDASGAPAGSEFRVNAYGQFWPSVAADAAGNFVVVWTSGASQDGSSYGIFGQRYDASGAPAGSEFRVNMYTTGSQLWPSVAADAPGNFVVVWNSYGQDGSGSGVFGQRYDASGAPAGSEFRVNTYTTSYQNYPSVAADAAGNFVVVWVSRGQDDGSDRGVFGQRYDASGAPAGSEFPVNTYTASRQDRSSVAADAAGNFVVVWQSYGQEASGFGYGVFGQRYGGLLPSALAMDASPSGLSDGNGVFEAGESVVVVPSWRNVNGADQTFTGTASSFTGPGTPGNPNYVLVDGMGDYGTVADAATGSCGSNCYAVGLSVPSARPTRHWDASVREDILPVALGQSKIWALHVGDSFPDVPRSHLFYRFIETIFHHGITSGCNATDYCPGISVTRGQMAKLLLTAKLGSAYTPPTCAGIFADVTCPSPFADWIEDLYGRGITQGCGTNPLRYCPASAVSRGQMAVLLLRTLLGSSYTPPTCAGIFADVTCPSLFADWIEDLYGRGITQGCGTNPLRYCPGSAVNRGQMAVFLTRTFGLKLYGP